MSGLAFLIRLPSQIGRGGSRGRVLLGVLCLLLIAPLYAQDSGGLGTQLTPDVDSATGQAWWKHIRPDESRKGFSDLPWVSGFAAGLARAREANKPLLFYGMNGHPLGCT